MISLQVQNQNFIQRKKNLRNKIQNLETQIKIVTQEFIDRSALNSMHVLLIYSEAGVQNFKVLASVV
jgi:hypothetical protein